MVVTTTYHQSLQTGSRLVHQGHNCADGLSYIGSCLEPHQSEGGSSRRIGCSLQIWNTITLCLFDKMQIHCLIFGMARVRDGPIVCWLNVTWSSICFWKSRTHPRLGIFLLKKASRCAHFFSSPDVEGHVGDWEGRRRQGCEEWLDPSGSVSLDQEWCAISIHLTDLIRICWHGPASAFTKVILKNIGSGWARHLVPRIWDKIKACHYMDIMDPVRLNEADVGIFNCFFAVPLLFFAVRWCCFLQGFLPLLSFWQLVMQSACALLVLRCPLLLWVLSVIVPGISEPLFPLPHQARDRNPCGFPATSPYTWPIAKQLLENCIAETWKQHTKLAHLPENGNKKLQNNCHPKKYPNNFNETLVVSIMFSTWWVPPSRQTMADISRQLNDLSWCFSLYNDKSNLVGNSDA